jgi:transcription termination factor Rho
MTDENLDSSSTQGESAPAPAAPKARRNTRRTPRKNPVESNVVYEGLSAAPAPRTRRRRADDVPASEVPAAPAPQVADELGDELAPPRIVPQIVVPRRPVEDVPTSFSSDEDERAPAPEPVRDVPQKEVPQDRSDDNRRRRSSRYGRDDFRSGGFSPNAPEERGKEPRGEERREDFEPAREDRGEENRERGDSREDDSREGSDERAESPSDEGDDRRDDAEDSGREDQGEEEGGNADRAEDSSDEEGGSREEGEDSDRDEEGSSGDSRENRGENQDRGPRRDQGGYRQGYGNQGYGQGNYNDRHLSKRQKFKLKKQQKYQQYPQGGGHQQGGYAPAPQAAPQRPQSQNAAPQHSGWSQRPRRSDFAPREDNSYIEVGDLPELEALRDPAVMEALAAEHQGGGEAVDLVALLTGNIHDIITRAKGEFALPVEGMPLRSALVEQILNAAWEAKRAITAEGVVEVSQDGWGLLTYTHDSYRVKPLCAFVPKVTMKRWGLKRGHIVKGVIQPPRKDLSLDGNRENCPVLLTVETIMGRDPAMNLQTTIFEELTPYYPTERFLLETSPDVKWDNVSMRVVDLLTPVGKGQRGLIVAPPRTGKTILQQGIANAIMRNNPESHLIVLLVDERPEEVTDFRRQIVKGEVVASTFDENAESHVHAAEMVIEKARRMVEVGRHVVILLDSITRLARAYNALAGNSGKILSGGVEATAMQKPKRFFGSARNIEGGGSLTILGTALVETGSRMDEVIFEEFKGTGNMELVLDRELVNKRIFPAINLEKSGTRKEELLYHPDEMVKVYGLRRAMKGVPSPDAMEMLITRVKKTKTNIEFLMGLNR